MERKRGVYFDVLNVLACLSVIGMHCNGLVHNYSDTAAWRQALAVDVLAYWAVPIFIMISGATMMNYRERYSTGTFMKRRFMKVGIPLVIWSAVFYGWKLFRGSMTWNGWLDFINVLVNFQIEPVYWFFAPLFMVYLSLPVLSRLAEYRSTLRYMLIVGFLTCSVLPFVMKLLGVSYWDNFALPVTGGYVILVLLGYLLSTSELLPWQRAVVYVLGVIGAATRYFYTVYATVRDGALNKLTWEYINWPSILLAVAIFVLVKYTCRRKPFQNEKFIRLVKWLSGASFGIYLIHVFIMGHLASLLGVNTASGWWRLFAAPAVYLIALTIVKLLQKIPYVGKYLFP